MNTPKIYKRVSEYDNMLSAIAKDLIQENLGEEFLKFLNGYDICCVDQRRGRFNSLKRTITIPKWVFGKKDKSYWIYYLAHELAHLFDYFETWGKDIHQPHGMNFMKWFKRVCPVELQHHEHGYKPRSAIAAGVPQKRSK